MNHTFRCFLCHKLIDIHEFINYQGICLCCADAIKTMKNDKLIKKAREELCKPKGFVFR